MARTSSTIVLQSRRADGQPRWQDICVESVRQWSQHQRFDYRMTGDEIFDALPHWYRQKIGARGPVLADLARLVLMQRAFDEGYQYALWLDADTLVFAPQNLRFEPPTDCVFGQETWVERHSNGKLRAWRNVHNAFIYAHASSVVVPFVRFTIESIAARIEPDKIAPQTMGPKLLSALHSIAGFAVTPLVGAVSPPVMRELASQDGPHLTFLLEQQGSPPAAANLCASLATDHTMMLRACERLLRLGGLPGPLPDTR